MRQNECFAINLFIFKRILNEKTEFTKIKFYNECYLNNV